MDGPEHAMQIFQDVPTPRTRYRMPGILEEAFPVEDLNDVQEVESDPGSRTWIVPVVNPRINYDLQLTEDANYVTLDTQIAKICPVAPEMYGLLHDLNSEIFEGKVIVERDIEINGPNETPARCDAIHFSKQMRKNGLERAAIVEEIAAFDYGASRVLHDVILAAEKVNAHLLPTDDAAETLESTLSALRNSLARREAGSAQVTITEDSEVSDERDRRHRRFNV